MLVRKTKWLVALLVGFLLVLSIAPLALGLEEGEKPPIQPQISLDQAISLALTNSEDYRIAKLSVKENKELADYEGDTMIRYSEQGLLGTGIAAVESSWYSYLGQELTYQMSQLSMDSTATQVANNVKSKYGAVLVAQAELESAESDRTLADQEYRIAKAQYSVGMMSALDFQAIEKSYESNDTAVETAQANLDSAFTGLNTLIGLGAGTRPVLTDDTVYEEIKVDNLESEVNRVLKNAPTVYQAEQTAQLKEYEINILGYVGSYRPYAARQAELQQAQLEVTSTRETMATATRNIYYSILSVEDSYKAVEDASEAARITAQKQQALFDAGMCTSYELEQAQNAVKSYDAQLTSLKWTHNTLLDSFATPWAAASS